MNKYRCPKCGRFLKIGKYLVCAKCRKIYRRKDLDV